MQQGSLRIGPPAATAHPHHTDLVGVGQLARASLVVIWNHSCSSLNSKVLCQGLGRISLHREAGRWPEAKAPWMSGQR